MKTEEFEKLLAEVAGTLHLRRNASGLRRKTEDPNVLQVWDISRGGLPYYVMSIADENGHWREPCAPDINRLMGQAAAIGGWNGWSAHVAREALRAQEWEDRRAEENWDDWYSQEGRDRVRKRCGWGRVYASADVTPAARRER